MGKVYEHRDVRPEYIGVVIINKEFNVKDFILDIRDNMYISFDGKGYVIGWWPARDSAWVKE